MLTERQGREVSNKVVATRPTAGTRDSQAVDSDKVRADKVRADKVRADKVRAVDSDKVRADKARVVDSNRARDQAKVVAEKVVAAKERVAEIETQSLRIPSNATELG